MLNESATLDNRANLTEAQQQVFIALCKGNDKAILAAYSLSPDALAAVCCAFGLDDQTIKRYGNVKGSSDAGQ